MNKLRSFYFIQRIVNKVKNGDKLDLIISLVVFVLFVLCCPKLGICGDYEFRGVFTGEQVFTTYCETCFLELPPEFLQSSLVLSVDTDNKKEFEKAVITAAKGSGWNLTRHGNRWKAEPIQNQGNLVYISCMDLTPINVPQYLYYYSVRADSLKCANRDRERARQDSVMLSEKSRQDSIKMYDDSLLSVRLPYKDYELRYYSFTKNFTDKIGIEWSEILAQGDLPKHFELLDSWSFYATKTNDTAFTRRQVNLSLDSSVTLDWGTEEQTLSNTLVNDGVVNQNYEWRKYGLIVKITNTQYKTKLEYTFRDKENGVSLLQGSAVVEIGDTLRIAGQYTTNRVVSKGIPVLSSIPLIGSILFATEQILTDLKNFELYLIPKTNKGVFHYENEDSSNAAGNAGDNK